MFSLLFIQSGTTGIIPPTFTVARSVLNRPSLRPGDMLEVWHGGSCKSSRVGNDDRSQLQIVWDLGLQSLATAHFAVIASPANVHTLDLFSSGGILLMKYLYYLKM